MDFNDLPDEVKLPIMAAVGGREQHIAALYDGQPVAGSAQSIEQAPTPVTDDFGNTPLTPGKAMHVDHLLAVETDSLAREVLITLKRDGLPPRSRWNEFMAPYALWSWDAESDARAWATLAAIAQSDWDEWLGHADTPGVEGVAQDKGDDLIEGLVIIDAGSGNLVLSKTGVRGPGGQQYLGLLDAEVEALQGLELIFVHNHPNGSEASEDDLDSAFRAGAELLIVITPLGQEFVYVRGRFGMVKVRDEKASYEVGPATLRETRALAARSKAQSRAYQADSPELIFLQSDPEVIANMDVNPDEIPAYNELKHFVNTNLVQLIGLNEEEIQMEMVQSMELIEDIFGYTVEFHEDYDVGAKVELAMEQVHNLGTILFHFLNDLGKEIMRSTSENTIYVLGADEKLQELHNVDDYEFRGHVFLPESLGEEDKSELKKVYLGSKIVQGAIAHEVSHELDRRAGKWSSVSESGEPPPVGSLEWFFKHRVKNRINNRLEEYEFGLAASYLVQGGRAARAEDRNTDREVFADLLPAKVLGPLHGSFLPSAKSTAMPIGFSGEKAANEMDIICAMEQYYDQYAEYLEHGNPEPKNFVYDPELCE